MKNSRTFFGRLLQGAAVTALSAVLFSALPVLKADAAAGKVTLSADGTLTLSGEVTKEQIWAYRENNAVKAVTAKKGTVLPADCSELFSDRLWETPQGGKQDGWSFLTSIDLHNADTSNVTNMWCMFYCSTVTSLDLRGIATSNVTNMCAMFYGCDTLTSLDLSSFDTSNVTTMRAMFGYCNKLTSLDLSSFDTSKVTDMYAMFMNCCALTSLDLSSFDTSNVTNMREMFYYCNKLTSLDLSSFDTSNVTDMNCMFLNCTRLISLDLSSFDTSKVTGMGAMFYYCENLTSLDLSSFDTSKVTNMREMFYYCDKLTSLDLSSFDTSNVTDMNHMFNECCKLTSLDLSSFDTSKVTGMGAMFRYCKNLTSLDLSSFDTSNVTDMNRMFQYCTGLISLDLSSFDTSNVTNMDSMFYYCYQLTSLDLSSFDTSNVTDMSKMFWYCYYKLTSIYVSDRWNTQSVTDSEDMFLSCYDLSGGNGTEYSSSHKDAEYARIDKEGQPGYFTASVFTAQPEDAYGTIGENAVFTVKATGKNLKYQWQYNNGHGWRNSTQEGCKTATLSVPYAYYRNGQQYRCVVTDAAGKKHNSFSAKMYVRLITAQPKNVTATAGKNAVFTVQAAGNNLKYCWQFNNGHGWKNSGMTGCKTATLTVPATAARNGQQYRCIVTAPNGITEISKEVKLTVK